MEDGNAVGLFERRILWTIFGGVFEHGAWRRRMNHELAELYGGPSILTVAKALRIRWLGDVMRMPDSCPTKKAFDSDPQFGIRRRGAQRTRWLDQVKRDLSEFGCLHGWETAARDRAPRRIVVDRAMSHREGERDVSKYDSSERDRFC